MPCLYVVATPLGNSGDLSPRAREALLEADLVLAEDTRRALWLFNECQVKVKKLLGFHEHNEAEKQAYILSRLAAGDDVALISDAGTPLMADPGYRLVRACQENGVRVIPIPGPSAPVAAISACGIAPMPFTFLGFLPRGNKDRLDLFKMYGQTNASLIFFERKDRLNDSLKIAHETLGSREVAVCRELTKPYEEIIITRLGCDLPDLLGEITVVIGPPDKTPREPEDLVRQKLKGFLQNGMKPKDAVNATKKVCSGWTGKEIYNLLNSK